MPRAMGRNIILAAALAAVCLATVAQARDLRASAPAAVQYVHLAHVNDGAPLPSDGPRAGMRVSQ